MLPLLSQFRRLKVLILESHISDSIFRDKAAPDLTTMQFVMTGSAGDLAG